MQYIAIAIYAITLLITSVSCTSRNCPDDKAWHGVGIYYWRTTWRLQESDLAAIRDKRASRIYLRLFDVVMRDGQPMPTATIAIDSKLDIPKGVSIVPVVFVDADVLRVPHSSSTISTKAARVLGQRIVRRVAQICQTHHIQIDEMQIDCDWTEQTEATFFELLQEARTTLAVQGHKLSVTIRLHQLAKAPPPADYGVLMLYNTSDIKDSGSKDAHNPILDERDVRPYLRWLEDYNLPLVAALPEFSWPVLYEGETFKGILYGIDLEDKQLFRKTRTKNTYYVIASRTEPLSVGAGNYEIHLSPGQHVKVWTITEQVRQDIRRAALQVRPHLFDGVIYYP